ncbi:uncharacterized protein B0T23DRAFT_407800 [Neurospora hispaniola]|uniref:Uncharacterized protein n=1 Tax=Neurospora hispaniola TaxID=588809 RepID=A0AAJ0MN83_9PEZI|nr:hypothetical protein B0T23DRAFT_407800 [Neurospora hispaniola]
MTLHSLYRFRERTQPTKTYEAEVCNTCEKVSVINCRGVIGCLVEMALASFVLKFFITGDSLAIAGSTLTVLYTFHQITVARHLQKELKKNKSNRNTLEETRVSNTVNRFQPGQILAANLLILHAALWAIVRSTLHLTFTIKQVRNPDPDPQRSQLYPMEWNMDRSDMKHLWGTIQTFTWGTLLFTAIPMLWMVKQFFPKVFLPRARTLSLLWNVVLVFVFSILWIVNSFGTTASHGVRLAMLAWVNLIMVSLLSSMVEIQRHATRAKVQDVPLMNGQWGKKRCAKMDLSLEVLKVF